MASSASKAVLGLLLSEAACGSTLLLVDAVTINAVKVYYREIYAADGVTDVKFLEHYPVSRLLGCVDVVGCVRCEELASWNAAPEGFEAQTDFCWICEQPKRLVIPFEMRCFQGVYNLEKKIFDAAVRGLSTVESPNPRSP